MRWRAFWITRRGGHSQETGTGDESMEARILKCYRQRLATQVYELEEESERGRLIGGVEPPDDYHGWIWWYEQSDDQRERKTG